MAGPLATSAMQSPSYSTIFIDALKEEGLDSLASHMGVFDKSGAPQAGSRDHLDPLLHTPMMTSPKTSHLLPSQGVKKHRRDTGLMSTPGDPSGPVKKHRRVGFDPQLQRTHTDGQGIIPYSSTKAKSIYNPSPRVPPGGDAFRESTNTTQHHGEFPAAGAHAQSQFQPSLAPRSPSLSTHTGAQSSPTSKFLQTPPSASSSRARARIPVDSAALTMPPSFNSGQMAFGADAIVQAANTLHGRSNIAYEEDTKNRGRRFGRGPGMAGSSSSALDDNKGLRHFSLKVCEKVEMKKVTTYNEVAECLVRELANPDEKNIRRRVYDALNVLMAMGIIIKNKKTITWVGLPGGPNQSVNLSQQKEILERKLKRKKGQLAELLQEFICFKNLIQRNGAAEDHDDKARLQLPYVLVQTAKDAVIQLEMTEDRKEVFFNFNTSFKMVEDKEVLQRLGMGSVTPWDLQRLVPAELVAFYPKERIDTSNPDQFTAGAIDAASKDTTTPLADETPAADTTQPLQSLADTGISPV